MKKIRLLFLTVLTVCNCLAASATHIEGDPNVCAGDSKEYIAKNPPLFNGTPFLPTWTVTPSNAVNSFMMVGQQLFVQWNGTFFSGCSETAILTADYGPPFTPVTFTVTVYKKPQHNNIISGPVSVLPVNSYTNELPVVQYTIGSTSCYNAIGWTTPNTPNGWNIISGHNTPTVQFQPQITSPCDATIAVAVGGGISCSNNPPPLFVTRGALARGEITNLIQWKGTNNTLVICPDDELLVDAHETSFCGDPNSKLFVAFIISDASWQNISEHNKWLSVSEYNALGGLSALDIRAFLAAHHPLVTINANSYYKVKIAVSGGSAWNERTFTVQTTQNTAPAPTFPGTAVLNPGGTHPKDVRLTWVGSNLIDYEILFQYSDGSTFPSSGTTTTFSGCSFPTYYAGTLVYEDILGLPDDYHFRFKVRECGCGEWSSWSPTVQMLKPGKPNDIDGIADDTKLVRVYPNPAGDMITVECNTATGSTAQVVIMDMTGKAIMTRDDIRPGTKTQIDVARLPSGLYMTVVTQGDEVLLKEKLSIVH